MEDMQPRVLTNPEKMQLRKSIVEHPLGTITRWMDQGYLLPRVLETVRGAMSLTIVVYNLTRVINILGVQELIAAVSYQRIILCRYKVEMTHNARRGQ